MFYTRGVTNALFLVKSFDYSGRGFEEFLGIGRNFVGLAISSSSFGKERQLLQRTVRMLWSAMFIHFRLLLGGTGRRLYHLLRRILLRITFILF